MAGLAADEKTELLILPQPKSLFEQLFESDLAIRAAVGTEIESLSPELVSQLRQAERLGRLFREPAVLVLPYQARIR